MTTLITCSNCSEVIINIDLQGTSYFGPNIKCGKCNSVMLNGQVYFTTFTAPYAGTVCTAYSGTAAAQPITETQATMTFTWPPKSFDIVDAEHATTCSCIDCKCKG
jgi:hypothetical protein